MADTTIAPGFYTFQQVFDTLGFDVNEKAAVEYESSGAGVDYRRVKVGGLGFDDPDQTIHVPESAKTLEVTLDDEVVAKATVK